MTRLSREDLVAGLALLDRVDASGSPDELVPIGLRLDGWLDLSSPPCGPDGSVLPGCSVDLGQSALGRLHLLPRARLRIVPDDGGAARTLLLTEVLLDETQITDRLRAALLARYLGGTRLGDTPPPLVPAVVADLLDLTPRLYPDGRRAVLAALADAMVEGPGWNEAATRLRTGFERALGDRSLEVVDVAARGLVRMAVGLGPRPPVGDPGRGLALLLRMPRAPTRAAALRAMLEVPQTALGTVLATAEPLVVAALDDEDLEVRRLASAVERRLAPSEVGLRLSRALESPSAEDRLAALRSWGSDPDADRAVTLPMVLEAADHADDDTAMAAVRGLLLAAADAPELAGRIARGLLEARREDAVRAGAGILSADPARCDDASATALRSLLDAPLSDHTPIVAALVARGSALDNARAIADLESMLWHPRAGVRGAVLAELAAGGEERIKVRDAVLPTVVEHLRAPIPSQRLLAARAVARLGPDQIGVIEQLAYDPVAEVRHGALALLRDAGREPVGAGFDAVVALVDTLFGLAADGRPDDRVHWAGALERLVASPSPRVNELLANLLRAVPSDSDDPFHEFAVAEIDRRLVERTECGPELVTMCRHLMAPPDPCPDHAARLAAACAASQPMALDFLWTMHTATRGEVSEIAARRLSDFVGERKSASVREIIEDLLSRTTVATERSLLRMMLRDGDEASR